MGRPFARKYCASPTCVAATAVAASVPFKSAAQGGSSVMTAASARRDHRSTTGMTRLTSGRGGIAEKPMRYVRAAGPCGVFGSLLPQAKATTATSTTLARGMRMSVGPSQELCVTNVVEVEVRVETVDGHAAS